MSTTTALPSSLTLSWERFPSPFISTFADKRHTRNWALAREDTPVRMMEIDTTRLPAGQVVRAADAYPKLKTNVPPEARTEHEYLCFEQNPSHSGGESK